MTPAQLRRARRIATAIALWRHYSARRSLHGVPHHMLASASWVERHLLGPRERMRRRMGVRIRAQGGQPYGSELMRELAEAPAHVVELIEVGSSHLTGYRGRCAWGHYWAGPVHVIGTEATPKLAAQVDAAMHDAEHHQPIGAREQISGQA